MRLISSSTDFFDFIWKIFFEILFFFHGHEVLRCSKVYPKEYEYQQSIFIKTWLKNYLLTLLS